MAEEHIVTLPGPAVAAASHLTTVWIVASGRLASYDGGGDRRWEIDAPVAVTALAAVRDRVLVAASEGGGVAWLDGASGSVVGRHAVGDYVALASGGGTAWAVDREDHAWRIELDGSRAGPVPVPGIHRFAADGERLWWTSRHDTLLRGPEHVVNLGVAPAGLAACAGSIWASAAGALLRVNSWSGELGLPISAPDEPAAQLDCADGVLVGGSERTLFVLDPRVDAEVRASDVALGGPLAHLLATRSHLWAIAEGRAEAHLRAYRSI